MSGAEFTEAEIERAKERWLGAETMVELGELTAQFLEGISPYFPGDLAPRPAEETLPIVEPLAALNRAGLVTITSQPGFDGEGFDGNNWKQRAYVYGFAPEKVASRLRRVTLQGDVVAYAVDSPANAAWMSIPAVQRAGEAVLWVGRPVGPKDLFFDEACNETMMEVLRSVYYVCLFDPKWGREGFLWEQVEQVL